MTHRCRYRGFSLTEVLLAAGILTVGFLLIAGVLPVGVKLTMMSTERTIGAVAADEAFAKMRLFGIRDVHRKAAWPYDPNTECVDYVNVSALPLSFNDGEFSYPSCDVRPDTKKYYWSALLRYQKDDLGLDAFQVTVFVNRHTGLGVQYPYRDIKGTIPGLASIPVPRVVPIEVAAPTGVVGYTDRINILDNSLVGLVTDESILVDGRTGQIMPVAQRNRSNPALIRLKDKLYDTDTGFGPGPRFVWVVPPAVGSGRYPGVGVYQRVIRFN
jgi:hypothetical protein